MDATDLNTNNIVTGTWGNVSKARARIIGQLAAAALLRFMVVPAGTNPLDLKVAVTAAFGAGATATFGLVPVDGAASGAGVINDASYFLSAIDLAAAGVHRADQPQLVETLKVDHYLVAQLGGTAPAAAGAIEATLDYEYRGL